MFSVLHIKVLGMVSLLLGHLVNYCKTSQNAPGERDEECALFELLPTVYKSRRSYLYNLLYCFPYSSLTVVVLHSTFKGACFYCHPSVY